MVGGLRDHARGSPVLQHDPVALGVAQDLRAAGLDGRGQRLHVRAVAPRRHAEATAAAAVAHEAEELPGRDLVHVGSDQRGAEALEQVLHVRVAGRGVEPVPERDRVGRHRLHRRDERVEQALRTLVVAVEGKGDQSAQPAAGFLLVEIAVPQAIAHPAGQFDHVQRHAQQVEGLACRVVLGHRDHDRAGGHPHAVALAVRTAAADVAGLLQQQHPLAGRGEARGGAEAAHAGADDDRIPVFHRASPWRGSGRAGWKGPPAARRSRGGVGHAGQGYLARHFGSRRRCAAAPRVAPPGR